MTKTIAACFMILGLLLTCLQAQADVIYNGFSDTSSLQLNAAASTAATSDGTVLRLTPAIGNRAGSAFSLDKVSTAEFSSIFSFRITEPGGPVFDFNNESGADGFVFVVQNIANTVGTAGQGIGYANIGTSIGVEYDTWGNAGNNDPSQSHIGIDLNGNVNHAAAGQGPTAIIGDSNAATTDLPGPELDDGDRWWSWVIYDGNTIDVYIAQDNSTTEPALPAVPMLSFDMDLNSILGGSDQAYVGFTSGTGSDWANHDILYWRYTEAVVPEPASWLTLAFGALVFGGIAHRHKFRSSMR
ncbi:L-type lectin-domain containing protein [Aeoliella mucimassa]|uniref:Legume lectin domain protein n=1 Tax=Aeoliella mucimassa TaxID=2527972 RepID=A0A518ARE7_9BACT|nr:L-type lectin-domain containing protein [Aeoliella mucimassa]QDU57298.1 Legume lectin domain protein [Aeoliella mucimassa]